MAAGEVSIQMIGVEELNLALTHAAERAIPVLTLALVAELQLVMLESQRQVPVGKTGALKASATMMPPVSEGISVTITLGYGGAASAYAVYVHNSPHELHWTVPGTKSHFLSDPLKAALPALESRLAARIENLI